MLIGASEVTCLVRCQVAGSLLPCGVLSVGAATPIELPEDQALLLGTKLRDFKG